jgi:hypothetical protein
MKRQNPPCHLSNLLAIFPTLNAVLFPIYCKSVKFCLDTSKMDAHLGSPSARPSSHDQLLGRWVFDSEKIVSKLESGGWIDRFLKTGIGDIIGVREEHPTLPLPLCSAWINA